MKRLASRPAVLALGLTLPFGLHVRADDTTGQLAALVKDGVLRMEIALDDGRVPVAKGFALQTTGRPLLALDAVARGGKVTAFCANVPQGALILRGSGLRPDIRIHELAIAEDGSIATARWRGEGFWSRLVLGLFGGLARKELGKLRFRTGVPELVRGELLAAEEPKPGAAAKATPAAPAAPPAPSRAEAFLRLVDEVRLEGSEITAFGQRPLSFGDALTLTTSERDPLRLSISEARFRPETATGIPAWRAAGTLDGRFGAGTIRWEADRLDFASGDLTAGRFLVESGFTEKSEIGAGSLALELTSGRFRLAGIDVTLAAPSRFAARKLESSNGNLRALVDLDLTGRTGEIRRKGSRLALADAHLETKGLSLAKGRADGDVSIAFDYKLVYPFVVQYPVADLPPRRVQLDFRGPFEAKLHLASVGAGGDDAVTGSYRFSVNWPPIEKAAFEALRARWVQQITGLESVSFEIEPEHFQPCGDDCFLASFKITAAKVGSRRLSLHCAPQGQAVRVSDLGLPAFTVIIGLLDGFNPCAMWVLLFLLSLLVNLGSRLRVLLIGGVFVITSGLVYFLFMAAWLNMFLIVGNPRVVEIILGAIAVGVGIVNLKDFVAFGRGLSLSIPASAKPAIYRRTRSILAATGIISAIIGAAVLASMVNVVELACTAGLPALYTHVLSLRGLSRLSYYGYLALYNLMYILDDALMLVIAVSTLRHFKLGERGGRWLKLVSGTVMFLLGALLLLRPDWLMA